MGINDFVEMTIFLCLICFSTCAKMQGFVDEYVWVFFRFMQKFKMVTKNCGKAIFGKISPVHSVDLYPTGQKFHQNCSISHCFRDKCFFLHFSQKFKIFRQTW